MVKIPGGRFLMGTRNGLPDEAPPHWVTVSGFYMDRHEVTNDQFAAFVKATGYRTVAERPLNPKDYPGVPKADLKPGAGVFEVGKGWSYVSGASWRHPSGPKSNLVGKGKFPVVQVAWDDAMAYAKWAGKQLPTEAQWEFAARGGSNRAFIWGNEPFSTKRPQANIWQGEFPYECKVLDGFKTTAPVMSFAPNPYGLFDMAGNVWEWCRDWYRPDAYQPAAVTNPKGPRDSYDPDEPGVAKRVLRGGSFLCADNYCRGYRPTARMKSTPDTGLFHAGFRCVKPL